MNTTSLSHFAFAGGAPAAPSGLGTLVAAVGALFQRRAALRELNALTDRELADIGLARSEIKRVFSPGFARFRG